MLSGASRHAIAYVSRMNDATPIRDFRGQPTDEPVDLDEAVPGHARPAEPQPEVIIEESDLAPAPNEQVIDAIIEEPEPASRHAEHPIDDVLDEPVPHETEPVPPPFEHHVPAAETEPAMEAMPAVVEPEPTVVPME